jgi:hypothetical protein
MDHNEIKQLVVRTRVHDESSVFSNEHDKDSLVLNKLFRFWILEQRSSRDKESESTLSGSEWLNIATRYM